MEMAYKEANQPGFSPFAGGSFSAGDVRLKVLTKWSCFRRFASYREQRLRTGDRPFLRTARQEPTRHVQRDYSTVLEWTVPFLVGLCIILRPWWLRRRLFLRFIVSVSWNKLVLDVIFKCYFRSKWLHWSVINNYNLEVPVADNKEPTKEQ